MAKPTRERRRDRSRVATQAPGRASDRRPRIGQHLVLEVNDLTLGGEAIARHGAYVLFLPGAIPGEQVVAEVVSIGPRYGRARVVRVVRSAASRVEPRCR